MRHPPANAGRRAGVRPGTVPVLTTCCQCTNSRRGALGTLSCQDRVGGRCADCTPDRGGGWRVSVADTGVGMRAGPEDLGRVSPVKPNPMLPRGAPAWGWCDARLVSLMGGTVVAETSRPRMRSRSDPAAI
jgi:hypothetical protein